VKNRDFGYRPDRTGLWGRVSPAPAAPQPPEEKIEAAVQVEPVEGPRAEPKAKPKASSSRWAEYGRGGGRVGGIKTSPAKVAAAKVNGARGGRPRKAVGS
jgi:hypothetical protein